MLELKNWITIQLRKVWCKLKQLVESSGTSGNFIPLTGTEKNKHISGKFYIEGDSYDDDKYQSFTYEPDSFYYEIKNRTNPDYFKYSYSFLNQDEFMTEIIDGDDYSQFNMSADRVYLEGGNNVTKEYVSLDFGGYLKGLKVTDGSNNGKGIYSEYYYGENYDDYTYVQKKYVDDNFVPKPPNTSDDKFYVMQNGVWVDITNKLNP